MNVIHVVIEPVAGGAEFLVREINRRLPAYGIRSQVVFLSNRHRVELESNEYCLDVHRIRRPSTLNKLRQYLASRRTQETIVHGHLTDALYALALPGIASGFRKIFTEHDTFNSRRSLSFFRPIEKRIYRRYDRIICISQGVESALINWLEDANRQLCIETINNGARLFDFVPQSSKRENSGLRLISVGSLIKKKGFDIAIKALAEVNCPVSNYILIGEGSERVNLERQARELGVSHLVEFVGWREDIEPLLRNADVQLIPSRWEGFGLVAVEGLSVGLKIVAADVPGLNEVLYDLPAAQLVVPDCPAALAEGIETVWEKKSQWGEMSIAARNRAEHFGLNDMVEHYSRVYAEVLQSTVVR